MNKFRAFYCKDRQMNGTIDIFLFGLPNNAHAIQTHSKTRVNLITVLSLNHEVMTKTSK